MKLKDTTQGSSYKITNFFHLIFCVLSSNLNQKNSSLVTFPYMWLQGSKKPNFLLYINVSHFIFLIFTYSITSTVH